MSEEHGLLFVEYKDSLVYLLSGKEQRSTLSSFCLPSIFSPLLKNTLLDTASIVTIADSLLFIIQLSVQLCYCS